MLGILKRFEKIYKVAIVLVDLVLINVAYIIAFLIKFKWDLPEFNFTPYTEAMPYITIAALVYFDIYGLLKFYRKTLYDAIISVLFVVILLGITTVAITYFKQGFSFPRSVLLTAPIIQFVLLTVWKFFILTVKRHFTDKASLMVVGNPDNVDEVLDKVIYSSEAMNFHIKYICTTDSVDDILRKLHKVNEVLLCPGVPDELKMQIMSYCIANRKVMYVVPQLFEISMLKARMVQFEDMPAFMIDGIGLTVEQKFFKRLFDIVLSIIGIIITSPIMIVTALLVKFSSPGPVFYSQERVTLNNKVFSIYKLRTMREDAEAVTGPVISAGDDPRVTAVGRILRKYRIDELPQLFNVLMGDMSIVGPRSERPFFVDQFSKEIPGYNQRSAVKAGITGFAQILGNYDTSPEDKLRYDLIYIKNYSLLLDIKLMFQTLRVVFTGNNVCRKSFVKNLKDFDKAVNI